MQGGRSRRRRRGRRHRSGGGVLEIEITTESVDDILDPVRVHIKRIPACTNEIIITFSQE